jgi:diguanylate cyclase (GGDEF)-like protein
MNGSSCTLQDIWDTYHVVIVLVLMSVVFLIIITSWMARKMHLQDRYARSILEASPNPMLVTYGKDLVDTNKILLKLAGHLTLEDFKKEHRCICDFFELGDTDEYLLPTIDDRVWVEHILLNPDREHKAKITIDGKTFVFKVTASAVEPAKSLLSVVVFTDISSIVNQSTTDALTGLANRLHFDLLLEHALYSAQRDNTPLSLIFFDIDHFKAVNDIFGHLAGDEVLRHIAHLVKDTLRKSDLMARWGGEEFIILLPNTELTFAARLAHNIQKIVAIEKFENVGYITCSFGVTQLQLDESEDAILGRVDELLYRAKDEGRNRVVIG